MEYNLKFITYNENIYRIVEFINQPIIPITNILHYLLKWNLFEIFGIFNLFGIPLKKKKIIISVHRTQNGIPDYRQLYKDVRLRVL